MKFTTQSVMLMLEKHFKNYPNVSIISNEMITFPHDHF